MFSSNTSQVSSDATYIEDVFSTYLYTGNGSTQTITNGIDLAGKGGLVWIKNRTSAADNALFNMPAVVDSYNTIGYQSSNSTSGSITTSPLTIVSTSFSTLGFGLNGSSTVVNNSGQNYASWTFRKQPKFFDVVTWTGDGVAGRQIAHNLGAAPGAIIVKCTSIARDWAVWQNTLSDGTYLKLNTTDSVITNTSFQVFGDSSGQTSTYFTVGKSGAGVNGLTNASGDTYVAYLFAHNAGGFGLTGTDNVISCGSFTTDASGNSTVDLGYEPQWVMVKRADSTGGWWMFDTMRRWDHAANEQFLSANLSDAEGTFNASAERFFPIANGFQSLSGGLSANATFIYIAIRRGPMKTPTTGTSVFDPDYNASFPQPGVVTTGFVADWDIYKRTGGSSTIGGSRLTGGNYLFLNDNSAETSGSSFLWDNNTGLTVQSLAGSGNATINWAFRRAPGFFDEVCYTGTGSDITGLATNLGAQPELVFLKRRNSTSDWGVGIKVGSSTNYYSTLRLNSTAAFGSFVFAFTSTGALSVPSEFSVSGATYVAYLFASAPGVSKVGSYTGTGTTQQINCGFTAGARFVLIKRTDSTGDWYVWDSARGIVAGNDPYLLLNSTAAEVTTTDYVDTFSAGFEISSTAPAAINASGGTFIYLAIA